MLVYYVELQLFNMKHDIIKSSVKECAYIRGVPENHTVLTLINLEPVIME